MDSFKQKNDAAPLRIYKPSGWNLFGFYLAFVLILIHFVVGMGIGIGMRVAWPFLILVPLYGFVLWILIMSSQQALAIHENGLEYRIGASRLFSRWEDMRYFERRSAGRSSVIGIYTINMDRQKSGNLLENVFPINHHNFIPLNTVHIPTRWDGCWTGAIVDTEKLLDTQFGRDLLYYAPHLFEYAKEKQKNG